MSEQQSQKRGVRSEAQKEAAARDAYEPLPPTQPVAGAFGEQQRNQQTDKDLAYTLEEKRVHKENESKANTE